MTREEAIEAIKEAYGNSEYTDEIIEALEQQPCEDTISRQVVKDYEPEPWEGFQSPCFDDFDNYYCDCYEIGEGGTPICAYDCERIIVGEPCHKHKTRGRDKG